MPARRHLVGPTDVAVPDAPEALLLRRVADDDDAALAALMLDAYAGTIDADGSETLETAVGEIAGWRAGASGEVDQGGSMVLDAGDGALAGAVLATRWRGRPFIAYVMTARPWTGLGVATTLVCASLRAFADAGEPEAGLVVTAGNTAAERIYARLGFRDAPVPPGPDA